MAGATEIVQLTKGAGEFQDPRRVVEATIAKDANLSAAVDLGGCGVIAIAMPSGWDAAGMTFQASIDSSTWVNVYDDANNEFALIVAASRWIVVTPSEFGGIRFLKVRSGTAASAVTQNADRVISLVVKPV